MPAAKKYRNAPLEYVILQVTHPVAPALSRGETFALKAALVGSLPLLTNETVSRLDIMGVVGGGSPSTQVHEEPVVRLSSRDKRTAVTFGINSIGLETTNYDTWESMRELAERVISARMDIAPVDGVERIGLRYIDEIRVPGKERPDWHSWINPKLAPPLLDEAGDDLRVAQQQSIIQYVAESPNVLVTLRYGAVVGPSAIQDSQLSRPRVPARGPYFLIDTDAAWAPGVGEEVPALEASNVLAEADVLHAHVKQLFEASLTDRLRTEVLNAE